MLRDQPHDTKGQRLTLGNKDLPDGIHKDDCWHKHFIHMFHLWLGRQADPWNVLNDEVVNALQKIWNVVYKKIPYKVEQKDAVCTVVHIKFYYALDAYKSYRPCNVPATRGMLQ